MNFVGLHCDDVILTTFISFSVNGEVVYSNRAIKFVNILSNKFKFRKALCSGYLSAVGVDMDRYFVYINYVVTSLNYFNFFISGKIENKLYCKESRLLLETAYAEFIIGENITKIFKKNPSFKIHSFELNTMSKMQFLEYCINNYGFERFMKSRTRGSIGGMNIMEMYI